MNGWKSKITCIVSRSSSMCYIYFPNTLGKFQVHCGTYYERTGNIHTAYITHRPIYKIWHLNGCSYTTHLEKYASCLPTHHFLISLLKYCDYKKIISVCFLEAGNWKYCSTFSHSVIIICVTLLKHNGIYGLNLFIQLEFKTILNFNMGCKAYLSQKDPNLYIIYRAQYLILFVWFPDSDKCPKEYL